MLSKLLLAVSLAVAPVVSVSAQAEYTEFDTFQTIDKYLQDFDYLTENTYRVSGTVDGKINYGARYTFYVFPIYYDVDIYRVSNDFFQYYVNDYYQFITYKYSNDEVVANISINNFVGSQMYVPFLSIDSIGMSQVIEHDKAEKSNSISIYNSFYNFFTGFFPNEVVAEYHGIFTFVIVAFLLFLVFGFVFFLFRVIRRLVGFK